MRKGPGRPRVAENKRRSIYICITCNREEVRMIQRKAKQYNVRRSTLIRMALEKI